MGAWLGGVDGHRQDCVGGQFIVEAQDEGATTGGWKRLIPVLWKRPLCAARRGRESLAVGRQLPTCPDGYGRRFPAGFGPQGGRYLAGRTFRFARRHDAGKPLSGAKRRPDRRYLLKGNGTAWRIIVGRDGAACHTSRVSVTILDREMYTEAASRAATARGAVDAALVAGGPPAAPPSRDPRRAHGFRNVTWAEFVKAGLLRSYRREHDAPPRSCGSSSTGSVRTSRCPTAVRPAPLCRLGKRCFRPAGPQSPRSGVLPGRDRERADGPDRAGREFFERVDWSGDEPAGWRPHEDTASLIWINPLGGAAVGMPSIGGISTEAIAGEASRGWSIAGGGRRGLRPGSRRGAVGTEL